MKDPREAAQVQPVADESLHGQLAANEQGNPPGGARCDTGLRAIADDSACER